jgi:hypothetical protein
VSADSAASLALVNAIVDVVASVQNSRPEQKIMTLFACLQEFIDLSMLLRALAVQKPQRFDLYSVSHAE